MDRLPGTMHNVELTEGQKECLRLGEQLTALEVERRTVGPGHVAKVDADITEARKQLAQARERAVIQQRQTIRQSPPPPSQAEARRAGRRFAIQQRLGDLAALIQEQELIQQHVSRVAFNSGLLDAFRAEEAELRAELARGGPAEAADHPGRGALEALARQRLHAIDGELSVANEVRRAALLDEQRQLQTAMGEATLEV